jgi:hypothetical protein
VGTDGQIADLDRRIAQVEGSLAMLRHEIAAMDRTKPGFLKVQELIALGERSVAKLKAERAKLAAPSQG